MILHMRFFFDIPGIAGELGTDQTSNPWIYIGLYWVNYNDLTATSLGIMVIQGNHPQMALIQVSEIL